MAKLNYKNGVTSVVLRVRISDTASTTGAGLTNKDHTAAGLIISTIADNEATPTTYTSAGSTIETITTLGTYAAPTATKCRFKKVDDTNHPGIYEIQIANARWAVSNARSIIISVLVTGGFCPPSEIQLEPVPANVLQWKDYTAESTTVSGVPVVDTKYIYGDSTAAMRGQRYFSTFITGTVDTGATTTSIPTSSIALVGTDVNQFKGKMIIFMNDASVNDAVKTEMSFIIASTSGATPTLTIYPPLTSAPQGGSGFIILAESSYVNAVQFGDANVTAATSVTFPTACTVATTTNIVSASGISLANNSITAEAIASDATNEIADAILSRNVSNVEATAGEHTLATVILATLEWSISGNDLIIKRSDGTTTHYTKTLSSATSSGDVITGLN